ncbi:MAG: hypothetical protein AAF196_11260 [Planctomycetota bacterium]
MRFDPNNPREPQRSSGPLGLLIPLGILLPIVVAFFVTRPAVDGGLISDDLLAPALFLDDEGEVRWDEVSADFSRHWLGLEAPLYRPMVSVSLAIDLASDDFTASMHRTNRWLHLLVTGLSAWLIWICVDKSRPLLAPIAALGGGLLVAIHPIHVECVSWIAARNSSLEVTFRLAALVAFAIAIRTQQRRIALPRLPLGLAAGFSALALGTKESAVVLAPSFVLLDLLLRCPPKRAELGRRLAPCLLLAPVFAAYLGLRLALFGLDQTGPATESTSASEGLISKSLALFLNGQPIDTTDGLRPLIGFVLLLAGLLNARRALLLCSWILFLFLPTLQKEVSAELVGSRFVYGVVPVLALVLATGVSTSRVRMLISTLGLMVLLPSLWLTSADRHDAYREAWDAQAALEEAVATIPDGSVAIAALPTTPNQLPPFNQNNWFLALQPPLADRGGATFGLGHQIVEVPGSEDLYEDTRIERILLSSDIPVLNLVPAASGRVEVQRLDLVNRPQVSEPVRIEFGADGSAPVPAGLNAFSFDLVRWVDHGLTAPDSATPTLELEMPDVPGVPESLQLPLRRQPDGSLVADCRPSLWMTALGTYALSPTAMRVSGDSRGSLRLETVTTVAWPDAVGERTDPIALEDLKIRLPSEPADASWHLHLIGPHATFRLSGRSGETLTIPPERLRDLALAMRMARTDELLLSAETTNGALVVTELKSIEVADER